MYNFSIIIKNDSQVDLVNEKYASKITNGVVKLINNCLIDTVENFYSWRKLSHIKELRLTLS